MNIWHLFSERRPQFASSNGFYSVYDQMSSQCTVCGSHWFLFCLSPYLLSEWHIVPQLCIQTKQSRVHSRKALSEYKASRRLGKQMRCFYRFLSKPTMGFRYTCVVFFLSSSHKKSEKTAMRREYQRRYYANHKEELQRKSRDFHRRLRENKRL